MDGLRRQRAVKSQDSFRNSFQEDNLRIDYRRRVQGGVGNGDKQCCEYRIQNIDIYKVIGVGRDCIQC